MTSTSGEPPYAYEGVVITDRVHALQLVAELRTSEEADAFVRNAVKSEAGREFLGSDEWKVIQRLIAERSHLQTRLTAKLHETVSGAALDDARWDSFIDLMVELPTVKSAHEFLCRLETLPIGPRFLRSAIWIRWLHAKFPEMNPASGAIGVAPRRPAVGDRVLYVSYGTPGGEYRPAERAATVTQAGAWVTVESTGSVDEAPGELQRVVRVWDPLAVHLFVMNPTGVFHPAAVEYDGGRPLGIVSEDWDIRIATSAAIGDVTYAGGTWHWPEARPRVDVGVNVPLDPKVREAAERITAGVCPDHGDRCASWVFTVGGGGQHVGAPRWRD